MRGGRRAVGGRPPLEGGPAAGRHNLQRVLGAGCERLADHHARFGPGVRIRDSEDACRDLTVALEWHIEVVERVGGPSDVGAVAVNHEDAGARHGIRARKRGAADIAAHQLRGLREAEARRGRMPTVVIEVHRRPIPAGILRPRHMEGGVRLIRHELGVVLAQTVGDIRQLRRVARRVLVSDGFAVIHHQGQVSTVGRESKVRVQLSARAVLARGKDDQIAVRREGRSIGKSPLGPIGGIVGQVPSAESEHPRRGIVQFDPIRRVTVGIEQVAGAERDPAAVAGHELVDDRRRQVGPPVGGQPGEIGQSHPPAAVQVPLAAGNFAVRAEPLLRKDAQVHEVNLAIRVEVSDGTQGATQRQGRENTQ